MREAFRHRRRRPLRGILLALAVGAAFAADDPLLDPECLSEPAPEVFYAELQTSKGSVVIEVQREWAPIGADRFYNLLRYGFYRDARFFRVIPGKVALFGLHASPEIGRRWLNADIEDDPVRLSNRRGTVAFAHAGPNTRTTQVFINLGDNVYLDGLGFPPFGRVVQGMSAVDAFYDGYGDRPPRGRGPRQEKIKELGNAYLEAEFPLLDFIHETRVFKSPVSVAPTSADGD